MTDRERLLNELKKAKTNCLIKEGGGCLTCTYRGQADCTLKNLADYLLANGVIVPPCKVGDVVYFLLEDDFPVHKWFISEEKITEVASGGFFTSSFTEPGIEDFGNYTAYTEIGVDVFLTKEEAEAKLKELNYNA